MFRKTLTALVAVAGLSFAGASFASPVRTATPATASSIAKPAPKKLKASRAKLDKKVAAKSEAKPMVKAQPRKAGMKVVRSNKKVQRPSVKPAAKTAMPTK
jgi:hypothetical protein